MTNLTKLTGAGAVAALLSATPALADFHMDWDVDADGAMTVDEFREGFSQRVDFGAWDGDGDGLLSEDEFAGRIFGRYDLDATDAIEEAEHTRLEEDFGEGALWRFRGENLVEAPGDEVPAEDGVVAPVAVAVASLEPWDVDGDGVILRNEFLDGFREWGTFGEFDLDVDGFVTEGEFAEGVFARYDDDLDGIIEEPELTDIGDDMGDEGFWDV